MCAPTLTSISTGSAAEPPNEGDAPEVVPKEEDGPAAPAEGHAVTQKKKRKRVKKERKQKGPPGPRTVFGRHLSNVWLSALKESIPLATTLAVCYLSCYIAREPILPTDLRKWAGEGRLPYLAAFVDISKSSPRHIPSTVGERQVRRCVLHNPHLLKSHAYGRDIMSTHLKYPYLIISPCHTLMLAPSRVKWGPRLFNVIS